MRWEDGPFVVPVGTPGGFWIRGQVLQVEGGVVEDALVETWQPDVDGVFCHPEDGRYGGRSRTPGFRGFGRSETVGGEFAIHTVRPGRGDDDSAPHLNVSVFARGLLDRVVTRIYLPDEDNSNDSVLNGLEPERADTLLATKADDGYRFDIRLRGDNETVFFEV
jgi:protocatechuate 3,4-dioxygenase alpha subunit